MLLTTRNRLKITHYFLFISFYATVCRALTIVANDTRTAYGLGCKVNSGQNECVWKGPNSQVFSSSATVANHSRSRVWVELEPGGLQCHLYFLPALLQDEGVWECVLDDDKPTTSWELIVQVRPSHPILSHSDGTELTTDSIHFDMIPHTMHLKCFSGHAKPKQKSIRWLINGVPPSQSSFVIEESPGGFFNATSFLNVTFHNDENRNGLVMENVTCIVLHLAGETSATAIIRIKYSDSNPNPNHGCAMLANFWLVIITATTLHHIQANTKN